MGRVNSTLVMLSVPFTLCCSGGIPRDFGNLTRLYRLELQNNELAGSFARELKSESRVVGLFVAVVSNMGPHWRFIRMYKSCAFHYSVGR